MTNHDHERALELIMRRGTEDLAARDADWLNEHLAACSECAAYEEDFDQTGHLLRSFAVTAGSSLVAATQARVHARAAELQEYRARTVLITVSFCIGALTSTMSAWLWWRFDGWLAQHLGLSRAVVEPGVFVAWMLPALVIAVLMLASSRRNIDRTLTMEMLGMQREGGRR
jgi:hypothetical protein